MPITTKRVVFTSFGVDLLDVVLNLLVVLATGSVVMLAELTQGVSDLAASGFLLIGLSRPKREVHFWTLASAFFMLTVASTLSFYFGFQRFLHPQAIENIYIAYAALLVSTVSNGYGFLLSLRRMLGRRKNVKNLVKEFSGSHLIMTKNTLILDLMGMSSALVGLLALVLYYFFGDLRFDGVGAMGIGIVLGFLSFRLIADIIRMPKNRTNVDEL